MISLTRNQLTASRKDGPENPTLLSEPGAANLSQVYSQSGLEGRDQALELEEVPTPGGPANDKRRRIP
jgi:hypothetical protein